MFSSSLLVQRSTVVCPSLVKDFSRDSVDVLQSLPVFFFMCLSIVPVCFFFFSVSSCPFSLFSIFLLQGANCIWELMSFPLSLCSLPDEWAKISYIPRMATVGYRVWDEFRIWLRLARALLRFSSMMSSSLMFLSLMHWLLFEELS